MRAGVQDLLPTYKTALGKEGENQPWDPLGGKRPTGAATCLGLTPHSTRAFQGSGTSHTASAPACPGRHCRHLTWPLGTGGTEDEETERACL